MPVRAATDLRIDRAGSGMSRFDVVGDVASGDEVATRAHWSGTLVSGETLSASFAVHFTFRDGLI